MCSGPQFSMVWEREAAGHTGPQSGIRAVGTGAETLSPFCLFSQGIQIRGWCHPHPGRVFPLHVI